VKAQKISGGYESEKEGKTVLIQAKPNKRDPFRKFEKKRELK